jgi:WhiB family redox-sensing transcriptional regulator
MTTTGFSITAPAPWLSAAESTAVTLLLAGQEQWMAEALCAQVDTDIFYPEKGGSTKEAKRVCRSCPVLSDCLNYALDNTERFGVWGGMSERERRKLAERAAVAA